MTAEVSQVKRVFAWIGVLAVAVAVGFGLGALTYEPPAPEMDVPQTAEPQPVATQTMPQAGDEVLPDLVGMQRAAASGKLDELGVLYLIDPVKGRDDDRVLTQNPAPGTSLRPSTNVLLQVRCDPKPCPPPPEGKQMYDPCSCSWR